MQGNSIETGGGALFELDEAAEVKKCHEYYASLSKAGWSVCPNGYAVFCQFLDIGFPVKLVLPGLKINGISKVSGKSDGLQIKLDAIYVERHIQKVFEVFDAINEASNSIIRGAMHNIRAVNSNIYNAAYECESLVSGPLHMRTRAGEGRREELIGNIVALSGIMSAEMDILDMKSGLESIKERKPSRIPVYKKFDKVRRCLLPSISKKGVSISLDGESFSYTMGPSIFELIPYILLDNAVKYAPAGEEVLCSVVEDHSNVIASVQSRGPQIRAGEEEKIFELGYRGVYAKRLGALGDGLGLAYLKKAVEELYMGEVRVETNIGNDLQTIDGSVFSINKFKCIFPIAD